VTWLAEASKLFFQIRRKGAMKNTLIAYLFLQMICPSVCAEAWADGTDSQVIHGDGSVCDGVFPARLVATAGEDFCVWAGWSWPEKTSYAVIGNRKAKYQQAVQHDFKTMAALTGSKISVNTDVDFLIIMQDSINSPDQVINIIKSSEIEVNDKIISILRARLPEELNIAALPRNQETLLCEWLSVHQGANWPAIWIYMIETSGAPEQTRRCIEHGVFSYFGVSRLPSLWDR
jgi:hypothetical protein